MAKRVINLLFFIFLLVFANAQVNDWENLEITQINAEKAHASYIPFERLNWEDNVLDHSPLVQILNGNWKFLYFENPGLIPPNIHLETNTSDWDNIRVPGNWQLQGDGK